MARTVAYAQLLLGTQPADDSEAEAAALAAVLLDRAGVDLAEFFGEFAKPLNRSYSTPAVPPSEGLELRPSLTNPQVKRWQKTRNWIRRESLKRQGKDILEMSGGLLGGYDVGGFVGGRAAALGKMAIKSTAAQKLLQAAGVGLPIINNVVKVAPLVSSLVGLAAGAMFEVGRQIRRHYDVPDPSRAAYYQRMPVTERLAKEYDVPPKTVANAMANIGGVAYIRELRRLRRQDGHLLANYDDDAGNLFNNHKTRAAAHARQFVAETIAKKMSNN